MRFILRTAYRRLWASASQAPKEIAQALQMYAGHDHKLGVWKNRATLDDRCVFWLHPASVRYFLPLDSGRRAEIRTIVEFWRGDLSLGRAFWLWGILGGGFVSLFATLLALMLVAAGAPAWLAVLVFAAHIPWNLVLLVGVWRSAGRPEVSRAAANVARLVILAWDRLDNVAERP